MLKRLFGNKDGSDARGTNADGTPGSGVGYAPTPSDGRDASKGAVPEVPTHNLSASHGISPAIAGHNDWLDEPSDFRAGPNANAPHGSGAQSGSPAFEYDAPRLVGMRPVEFGPLDGGLTDPIRDGDTPTRPALSRFFFNRERWHPDISGDFTRPNREIVGDANRQAAMPVGRMNPMDEYRLLGDGSHA